MLGFFAVLFAEVVEEQFARLLGGDFSEALEFADEVVALACVLAGKFGGVAGFGFGGGL